LLKTLNKKCFQLVHGYNLIYNTCWEDPRLDRAALELGPQDSVLVITSAGCNALDYALLAPRKIYAVDMNPRQNALLELKLAGINFLDFKTFFAMFGQGQLFNARRVYREALRDALSPAAQAYWDRHIGFFSGKGWRRSFYFRGTAGTFARLINFYIDRVAKVRDEVMSLLEAPTIGHQREIYERSLRNAFWRPFIRWTVRRDTTLSLLGVPAPQRQQVEHHFPGGIGQFIEDAVETVFTKMPLADNYFWRVYLTGEYTTDCCPEYLKKHNFVRLQAGLADRVSVASASVRDFLERIRQPISRFVLLDHMDWLASADSEELRGEWQAILNRAAPQARVLWRSGGLRTDFVDEVLVTVDGMPCQLGDLLRYRRELADDLHARDRVHTYGSFAIADIAA
jgi:S-adenosylmethionine-diacylglycerol 3-amino-3-carboxypropyl transferase